MRHRKIAMRQALDENSDALADMIAAVPLGPHHP